MTTTCALVLPWPGLSREPKHVASDGDGNFLYNPFKPDTPRNTIKMY